MTTNYFDITMHGSWSQDREGFQFRNDTEAFDEAKRITAELLFDDMCIEDEDMAFEICIVHEIGQFIGGFAIKYDLVRATDEMALSNRLNPICTGFGDMEMGESDPHL